MNGAKVRQLVIFLPAVGASLRKLTLLLRALRKFALHVRFAPWMPDLPAMTRHKPCGLVPCAMRPPRILLGR